MKERLKLFTTAFLQVMFVSMNVIFISSHMIIPMLITGFLISIIWTLNVKRIVFATWEDRIIYATGAMVGSYLGFILSLNLYKLWQ